MTNPVIPAEAVRAAFIAIYERDHIGGVGSADIRRALEAAAPHMLIHVHHHDIEKHAESFNEGYETCMAQELADDPTTAQDWLDEKLRAAKAEAWEEGYTLGYADCANKQESNRPNPYMLNTEGEK